MRVRFAAAWLLSVALGLGACTSKGPSNPGDRAQGFTSSGSCVEPFTFDNLQKRDFGFDGTVKAVTGADSDGERADLVTFMVSRWYRGGAGREVTLKAYGFGQLTSAGSISGAVGERLLVSGEEDIAWGCGFTQPYEARSAHLWEQAFTTTTETPD
jgi:hypothetical protein